MAIFHCPLVWPLTRFNLQPPTIPQFRNNSPAPFTRIPGRLQVCDTADNMSALLLYWRVNWAEPECYHWLNEPDGSAEMMRTDTAPDGPPSFRASCLAIPARAHPRGDLLRILLL